MCCQFTVHSSPLFQRARQRQQLSADALLVVGKLLCDDAATLGRMLLEFRRAKRQTFLMDRFFCRSCQPWMIFLCECNGSSRYMCVNQRQQRTNSSADALQSSMSKISSQLVSANACLNVCHRATGYVSKPAAEGRAHVPMSPPAAHTAHQSRAQQQMNRMPM